MTVRSLILCCCCMFCGAVLCAEEIAGSTSNAPAIRVNSQVISIREVEQIYADSHIVIQDRLRRGALRQANLGEAIKAAWTDALETAAQDRIIDQRADQRRQDIIRYYVEAAGAQMGTERARELFRRDEADRLRRLRRELVAAAGGEAELRAALKRRGQTMRAWEDSLTRELFRRDIMALELGPIARSPGHARSFYEKNPELFRVPEAWRLRRIRVAKANFSSPEKAREAAGLVKEKLKAGGDFGTLAATISDDAFAKEGGLLTRDGKTDLPTGNFPFEEAVAEQLRDGEISEPIEAGSWFILVQRMGYQAAKVQTFEEAAERAEALAYSDKLKQKKKEAFEKLKRESFIEYVQTDPPAHLLKDVDPASIQFIKP